MRDKLKQKRWQLNDMRQRRQKWLDANGPCRSCGSTDRLEVDHIDPKLKAFRNAHSCWSWTPLRREAELAKCQVLCHECHKQKTIEQFKKPVPHGTHSGYSHHGCRCEACRNATAAYNRSRYIPAAMRSEGKQFPKEITKC